MIDAEVFEQARKQAWADRCGIDVTDERVQEADKVGWPSDYGLWENGWNSAMRAVAASLPEAQPEGQDNAAGQDDRELPGSADAVRRSQLSPAPAAPKEKHGEGLTPRTEEQVALARPFHTVSCGVSNWVRADYARHLERELSAALERADRHLRELGVVREEFTKLWNEKQELHGQVAAQSATAPLDPLPTWKGKPSADLIEAHYPGSQHQPDECEMCRFIHDAAKAYVAALDGGAKREGKDG